MKSFWIMAQGGADQAQDVIGTEPMSEQGQAGTKEPVDPNLQTGRGRPSQGFGSFQILLIVVMLVFVFMMFRGPRKKQQEHKKMVQSLQKNDRVRTIGGIYGTIVETRDDEIVLKVDEANNTKIRVSPSAIGTKLSDEKS